MSGWIAIGEVAASLVKSELAGVAPRRMTVPAVCAQIPAMPDTPREAFKKCRKADTRSLPELAKILGTPTVSMIQYFESGHRRMPPAWIPRLPKEFTPVLEAIIREKLRELDELEYLLRRAKNAAEPKPVPGSWSSYKASVANIRRLSKNIDAKPGGE